jgi:hypothetical protein
MSTYTMEWSDADRIQIKPGTLTLAVVLGFQMSLLYWKKKGSNHVSD